MDVPFYEALLKRLSAIYGIVALHFRGAQKRARKLERAVSSFDKRHASFRPSADHWRYLAASAGKLIEKLDTLSRVEGLVHVLAGFGDEAAELLTIYTQLLVLGELAAVRAIVAAELGDDPQNRYSLSCARSVDALMGMLARNEPTVDAEQFDADIDVILAHLLRRDDELDVREIRDTLEGYSIVFSRCET